MNDDEKFLFAWGLVISEYKIDGYLVGSRCGQNFYSSLIIVVCGCCKRSGKCGAFRFSKGIHLRLILRCL